MATGDGTTCVVTETFDRFCVDGGGCARFDGVEAAAAARCCRVGGAAAAAVEKSCRLMGGFCVVAATAVVVVVVVVVVATGDGAVKFLDVLTGGWNFGFIGAATVTVTGAGLDVVVVVVAVFAGNLTATF